jgi:hypothetical protein
MVRELTLATKRLLERMEVLEYTLLSKQYYLPTGKKMTEIKMLFTDLQKRPLNITILPAKKKSPYQLNVEGVKEGEFAFLGWRSLEGKQVADEELYGALYVYLVQNRVCFGQSWS